MTLVDLDSRPFAAFAALVSTEGTSTVVTLQGEADIFTLPAVVDALERVRFEHEGPVVVDLAKTSFLDVRTMLALGSAAQLLAGRGRTLTVRGPSRMARRLITLLDLADVIQIGSLQPAAPR